MQLKISRWVLVLISIALGIQGSKFLNEVIAPQYAGLGAAIAVVLATVFEQALEALFLEAPMSVRFLRRLFDPRAAFEGTYAIFLPGHPERPHAYATIAYNTASESYLYSGKAFGRDRKLEAHWQSKAVTIDVERNQVQFFAEAMLFKDQPEQLHTTGLITFQRDKGDELTRAEGFFVDAGEQLIKRHFFMKRTRGFPMLMGEA
jgi:hypothetical protein